jgi:flavin-dependent dehydrogenase
LEFSFIMAEVANPAARLAKRAYDLEISTDVLVIGGGPAGAWAALAAAERGASVIVAEKGYTGTAVRSAAPSAGSTTSSRTIRSIAREW